MTDETARLEAENTALRAIAAKVMPCHFCGAESMGRCPYGFPGCALADDMSAQEYACAVELKRTRDALRLVLQYWEPGSPVINAYEAKRQAVALLDETPIKPRTDTELRAMWRAAGGAFYGPHVEHGTMEEQALFVFIRKLLGEPQ